VTILVYLQYKSYSAFNLLLIKEELIMKTVHFSRILILLIVGSTLFFSCEKQESNALLQENGSISALKGGGPGGYALYFDGDGDYVMVPDAASLDLTVAFTVVAWVNIESYVEWASIVTKGYVDGDNNYTIHQSGPLGGSDFGRLRFTCDRPSLPTSPYLESTTQIPLNEWHFVAATWDGATMKFYFDGELDGSGAFVGPLLANDEALYIGADYPGAVEYWQGMIDEVRIWNEALKQTHIQAAMNGSATPLARALVGYWRFDEGSGTVAGDRSKYKNDGVLVGDASWVDLTP